MKKIIIIIVVVLIFLVWKKAKKGFSTSLPEQGEIPNSIIQLGSTGIDVRRLQMKLNELIRSAVNQQILVSYTTDNITYPISQQLIVDGIFGNATAAMLYAVTGKTSVLASDIDSLHINPAF